MTSIRLDDLLTRTARFHQSAVACIASVDSPQDARHALAYRCGLLSVEHAAGMLALLAHGLKNPAFALLRPQYETLLRGIWLLYAAGDEWVARFSEPLSEESARRADGGPMPAAMLEALSESGEAPAHIVAQLDQYRAITWKALNSFAHGGAHPIGRSADGYPEQLMVSAVRNSNALICLAAQLAAVVSGMPERMDAVRRLHEDFPDCIPLA